VAAGLWVGCGTSKFAVLTGGEPMLQFDADLFLALRRVGFDTIAMETNGSVPLPADIRPDWLCVSPKAGALLIVKEASELKLVYPQKGLSPEDLSEFTSGMRWLSPMDGPNRAENTKLAADYCLRHPAWRLAIQAHKTWGLP
jgi:organic radical activating enzyme